MTKVMKEDPGVFYVRFLFLLQENGYKFSLYKYLKTNIPTNVNFINSQIIIISISASV